ncbi:MAG: PilZ domain-containing protein [Vicinamibacterales bacterium]
MTHAEQSAVERRRAPRVTVPDGVVAGIATANSVRVVDISLGGVLLASSKSATVGARGRLSFTIGGNPLAAEVEIRRVSASPDASGFRIGARFVDITPTQREAIERFARS